MYLFSYASIAFSTALTTSTFLLFFSSLSMSHGLSIGELNHNKIKQQIIYFRSTIELGNPIAIINVDVIKGITTTVNKIDSEIKLKRFS